MSAALPSSAQPTLPDRAAEPHLMALSISSTVWYGRLLRSASASRCCCSRCRRLSPTSPRRALSAARSSFCLAVSDADLLLKFSLMLPTARILARISS